jgi:hypothetical protein
MSYDNKTGNLNTAENQVRSYIKSYHAAILPIIEPVAVEQTIEKEILPGFTITGTPDIREAHCIRDEKTGIKAHGHEAQLGCYSILSRLNGLGHDFNLVIDHAPRNRISFQTITLDREVCEAQAKHVVRLIIDQWRAFGKTNDPDSFPANPASFLCSEKYCQCYNTEFCKYGRKRG